MKVLSLGKSADIALGTHAWLIYRSIVSPLWRALVADIFLRYLWAQSRGRCAFCISRSLHL